MIVSRDDRAIVVHGGHMPARERQADTGSPLYRFVLGELRVPLGDSASRVLVAEVYQRGDQRWAWSASITWTHNGEDAYRATERDTVVDDEATAERQAIGWLLDQLPRNDAGSREVT